MTTLQNFIDDVRTSLEDYGDTITDNWTGDNVTKIWKLSSFPIKTGSDTGNVTVGGVVQTNPTNYSINSDNGEITFVAAPGNGVAVAAQYVKVVWRDERIITGIQAGLRELFPAVYVQRECYLLVQNLKYDYDLTTTGDVPDNFTSTYPNLALPANYSPAQARLDFADVRTRIGWAEIIPFGTNQTFQPMEFFHRTTTNIIHIDFSIVPFSVIKFVYAGPPKLLAVGSDVADVPDAYYMLPVWYALSTLMEKKEAPRSRYDQYAAMQNTQAVPPGTQSQTADDFLRRFYDTLSTNAMRPMRMRARRELRTWQFYQR
jgi:hypothetical protein